MPTTQLKKEAITTTIEDLWIHLHPKVFTIPDLTLIISMCLYIYYIYVYP